MHISKQTYVTMKCRRTAVRYRMKTHFQWSFYERAFLLMSVMEKTISLKVLGRIFDGTGLP